MSILAFTGLTKTLTGGRTLFSNIAASIEEPESLALVAPSGQGKSTLLRLLALLDSPCSGELLLEGKPSSSWQPRSWRRKAAYVAQQAVMLPGSVESNLRISSLLHETAFDEREARQLMEAVGLSAISWAKPAEELSGGEKQRVSLVRTLLGRPTVLLLDESTASLDLQSKQAVEQLLLRCHTTADTTLIWVSHDLGQARRVSSRIWFLAEERLIEGETEAFFREPPSQAAEQFLQQQEETREAAP